MIEGLWSIDKNIKKLVNDNIDSMPNEHLEHILNKLKLFLKNEYLTSEELHPCNYTFQYSIYFIKEANDILAIDSKKENEELDKIYKKILDKLIIVKDNNKILVPLFNKYNFYLFN